MSHDPRPDTRPQPPATDAGRPPSADSGSHAQAVAPHAGGQGRSDINPLVVQRFLNGVDYPASRDDLLECARANAAPREVMDALEQLPPLQYATPGKVAVVLGQLA